MSVIALPRVEATRALEACVKTFQKWLHLPDPGALLVTLAAVVANLAEGDPLWLLLVGSSGVGKTELLTPLTGLPYVHVAATITEPGLLSGTPKRDRAQDARGGLLRDIGAFGIIALKDFGSMMNQHTETRASAMAALREVYDGSWTRHVGVDGGRTLSWSGKVGLIAGCTPAIDSHHAVIASMGERFLTFRLSAIESGPQMDRAFEHAGQERVMRKELAAAVRAVIEAAPTDAVTVIPTGATRERLIALAELAVRCRSAVERDAYTRDITLIPDSEAPARMGLSLLRLLNALGALSVDDETRWRLVVKVALDSMPAVRRTVLDALLPRDGSATTAAVAQTIGYPTSTTRRALEDLAAHRLLERLSGGKGKADGWMVNEWTRTRWPTVPEKPDTVHRGSVPEKPDDVLIYPAPLSGFPGKVPSNGHGQWTDKPEWESLFDAGGPDPDEDQEL